MQTYYEGVLFLVFTKETECLEALVLWLTEESKKNEGEKQQQLKF